MQVTDARRAARVVRLTPHLLSAHLPCSWGRIAGAAYNGYMPSPAAIELMWDRTKRLSLAFDPQGASNMLVGGPGDRAAEPHKCSLAFAACVVE